MKLFYASADRQNGVVRSRSIPRVASILWAVSWLLLACWLCLQFSLMRQLDPSFAAHNHIHWFRRVAMPWFYEYSVFPSVVFAALILIRDAISRSPAVLTYSLLAVCTSLSVVGLYTVRENFAVMHQFVL